MIITLTSLKTITHLIKKKIQLNLTNYLFKLNIPLNHKQQKLKKT